MVKQDDGGKGERAADTFKSQGNREFTLEGSISCISHQMRKQNVFLRYLLPSKQSLCAHPSCYLLPDKPGCGRTALLKLLVLLVIHDGQNPQLWSHTHWVLPILSSFLLWGRG